MTPIALHARLCAHAPTVSWPHPSDATALLRAVEAQAEAHPHDGVLARALDWATDLAAADPHAITAHIRRETLLRADRWSSTWEGVDERTGRPAMVRVAHQDSPAARRRFDRVRRALAPIAPELRADPDGPSLVWPLPGPALEADSEDALSTDATLRLLTSGLQDLQRWADAGLALPALHPAELRHGEGRVSACCLTLAAHDDEPANLGQLFGALTPPTGADLEPVAALFAAPPHTLADAAETLPKVLANVLAGQRHSLARRHQRSAHVDRAARLHETLGKLVDAAALPTGHGAIGVDLNGATTRVESDGTQIWWGTGDDLERVYDRQRGFVGPQARRLLRAHAQAPTNPRLQEAVDGDAAAVDAICRWVSLAMRTRTIRLLLEQVA